MSIVEETNGLPLVDTQPVRRGISCNGYFVEVDEARAAAQWVRDERRDRRLLAAALAVVYWSPRR